MDELSVFVATIAAVVLIGMVAIGVLAILMKAAWELVRFCWAVLLPAVVLGIGGVMLGGLFGLPLEPSFFLPTVFGTLIFLASYVDKRHGKQRPRRKDRKEKGEERTDRHSAWWSRNSDSGGGSFSNSGSSSSGSSSDSGGSWH